MVFRPRAQVISEETSIKNAKNEGNYGFFHFLHCQMLMRISFRTLKTRELFLVDVLEAELELFVVVDCPIYGPLGLEKYNRHIVTVHNQHGSGG